jgi:hypothetical protein
VQVFDEVSEMVQSALDGYHVCLFSYGQTGAGKTYTMSGGNTPEQQGLMPRAVNQVRTHWLCMLQLWCRACRCTWWPGAVL